MSIIAFDRFGRLTDADALLARYNVVIHPAEREGPITPGTPVARVTAITESYGKAYFQVNVPAGYQVRMVIPGEDRPHPTEGGVFTISANTKDATYYPLSGGRGLYGFGVAGVRSDYIDGLGYAFGAYDDQSPDQRPREPYGYLQPTFSVTIAGGEPAPQPTPTPTPAPEPAPAPGQGITLTMDEAARLMSAAGEIQSVIRQAVNREPGT